MGYHSAKTIQHAGGTIDLTALVPPAPTESNIIYGTAGNDTIYGTTTYNDNINTFEGNDYIIETNGTNIINAGAGNDTISISGGNNTVFAGTGNDSISVSDGNSTLCFYSGDGSDTVYSSFGTSTLIFDDTLNANSI